MLDLVLVISVLDAKWMSYATMQDSKSHVMSRWKTTRLFNVFVITLSRMIRRFPLDTISAIHDVGRVSDLRDRPVSPYLRWTCGERFGSSLWRQIRRFKKVNIIDMVTVDVIGLSRCIMTCCCCR